MAWTYSDYATYSDTSDRLERLRLHIVEVSDEIQAEGSDGGTSLNLTNLRTYLQDLKREEKDLGGQAPRAGGRTRVLRADFIEPRGID